MLTLERQDSADALRAIDMICIPNSARLGTVQDPGSQSQLIAAPQGLCERLYKSSSFDGPGLKSAAHHRPHFRRVHPV